MAFSSILLTLTLHWTQPLGGRVPWLSLSADNGKGLKEHRILPYPANLAENKTRTKDRLHYPKRYESTHLLHAGPEVYVYNEIA